MKFLLEFNQFNDDSLFLSNDLKDEIKETLTDYLEYVVEERLPEIREGKLSYHLGNNKIYAFDRDDNEEVSIIYVKKQDYLIPLEKLSEMLKKIDEDLICFSAYNASVVICNKRVYNILQDYLKLPDALENVVYEITDGYGKWQRWKHSIILEMEVVEKRMCVVNLKKIEHDSPTLQIKFFIPDLDYWQNFEAITYDIYFDVKSHSINTYKKKQVFSEFKDIKSTLESSNEVFMYDFGSSKKSIESELLDWFESEVLIYFEDEFSKKFDRFKQILKDINEIELDYDEDYDFDVESTFEVVAKYKGLELILNFLYDFKTDNIKIFDEFDKLLDECPLENLQESLFLIMTENR